MIKLYSVVLAVWVNSVLFPAACAESKEIKQAVQSSRRVKLSTLSAVERLKAAGDILTHPDLPDDAARIIWEMAKETTWKRRNDKISAVEGRFSRDGRFVTTMDENKGMISVIDVQGNTHVRSLLLRQECYSWACSDDGSVVAIANRDARVIQIYKALGYRYEESCLIPFIAFKMIMSADGTTLALLRAGSIVIWDITHNRQSGFIDYVRGVLVASEDCKKIAGLHAGQHSARFLSGHGDLNMPIADLWDYNIRVFGEDRKVVNEFPNKGEDDSCLAISGNGNTLACYNFQNIPVGRRARIRVWDCTMNKLLLAHAYDYNTDEKQIDRCRPQLSYDGLLLVVKPHPDKVELWDTKTGTIKKIINSTMSLEDSPLLATSSLDILIPNSDSKTSCVWSLGAPSACELIMAPKKDAEEADALCNRMEAPFPLKIRDLIAKYVATPKIRELFVKRYGIDLANLKESKEGAGSMVPAKK